MNKKIREWIGTIIYILMGLQILLGAAWGICNIGKLPAFGESQELLAMSESLVVDEYTGFLYVWIIRMVNQFGTLVQIPGYSILYILQLVTAYCAYRFFLKRVVLYKHTYGLKLRKRVHVYALYIVTLPLIMQVHMAVLAYSLASSLFVILLAQLCMLWRRDYVISAKTIIIMILLWVSSAIICPDYCWLVLIIAFPSAIRYMMLHKSFAGRLVVMIIAALVCILSLNHVLQVPGSTGKIQKSWESSMLTRIVWPNFNQLVYFWPQEIGECWTNIQLTEFSKYPEKVIYEFGPVMEELYGTEEAKRIYRDMMQSSFSLDTKRVVLGMLEDCAAYLCPPIAMFVQLQGIGNSYTGWNYGRFKDYSPALTKWYVDISLRGFLLILLSCIALEVLLFKKRKRTEKKEWIGACLGSVSILMNLWYMMVSGHMQDYKKVIVISILWCMFFVKTLEDSGNKLLLNE